MPHAVKLVLIFISLSKSTYLYLIFIFRRYFCTGLARSSNSFLVRLEDRTRAQGFLSLKDPLGGLQT